MRTVLLLLAVTTLFSACQGIRSGSSDAPLTVNRLFSDGVILQRDVAVPIWGTAGSPSSVSVALNDDVQSASGSYNSWQAALEPQSAGGPHTITVSTAQDTIIISDVWFGDVWIASGQSNMAWTVRISADAENEIASANDPLLREFKVPLSWSFTPETTLAGGQWYAANPDHVANFSAVAYSFARDLRATQNIPIGIVNTSWGGSRIEAWMTAEELADLDPDVEQAIAMRKQQSDSLREHYLTSFNATQEYDAGMPDTVALWADPELDISAWRDIPVPGNWESAGVTNLNGFVWYRTTLELSEEDANENATLHLGTIDDRDMTWMNGHLIGQTNGVRQVRTYEIPASTLNPGLNTLTVRVHDTGGWGGMVTDEGGLELRTQSTSIPLAGTWQFHIGQFEIDPGGPPNQQPTLLYNKMLNPILPYPVTGFIWYQGESNGGNPEDAAQYAAQFQSMIATWRTLFANDDAPFLYVSLASFRAAPEEPAESNWAILRESQAAALELPKVGEAITLDIGEADDIHPRNKQDVGRRLALAARYHKYGEDLVYAGPVYRDHAVDGQRIVVTFDHVGSGLTVRGETLGGFAIAAADGAFVWADARLEDNTVIVSHPSVPEPVDVRYAWADNPARANLFNEEGLPAAPFRTGR